MSVSDQWEAGTPPGFCKLFSLHNTVIYVMQTQQKTDLLVLRFELNI